MSRRNRSRNRCCIVPRCRNMMRWFRTSVPRYRVIRLLHSSVSLHSFRLLHSIVCFHSSVLRRRKRIHRFRSSVLRLNRIRMFRSSVLRRDRIRWFRSSVLRYNRIRRLRSSVLRYRIRRFRSSVLWYNRIRSQVEVRCSVTRTVKRSCWRPVWAPQLEPTTWSIFSRRYQQRPQPGELPMLVKKLGQQALTPRTSCVACAGTLEHSLASFLP